MTTIALGWPTGPLFPNRRPHWTVKAKHIRSARIAAWAACQEAGLRKGGESATLTWAFLPPDRRRRDLAEVISASKAAIDGIADALGIDDSRFRMRFPEAFGEPTKGGAVIVTVEREGQP